MLLQVARSDFVADCCLDAVRLITGRCICLFRRREFCSFPCSVIVVSSVWTRIVAFHAITRPCRANNARARQISLSIVEFLSFCACAGDNSLTAPGSPKFFCREMTMVMDSSSVVTMAEPGADALGFVFDASSGLYYDASSGFYYDAKAGWYYNTQDGQYYVYENDAYVPLAATTSDETVLLVVGDKVNQSLVQNATGSPSHEEDCREEATTAQESPSGTSVLSTQIAGPSADQEAVDYETPSQIIKHSTIENAAPVVTNSEWQDASCEHVQSATENPRESGSLPGAEMSSLSTETAPKKTPDNTVEAAGRGESVGEPEETRPASVWIAEALTELYSQNTYEGPTDGGEPELYVDPSAQHLYYQSNSNLESNYDYAYMRDDNEETWQEAQYHDRRQWGDAVAWDDHATMDNDLYESDDQSEELEEGEWRPEEEEKENYIFADNDEVEEGEIREDLIEGPGNSGVDGEGNDPYSGEYPTYGKSSPANGEGQVHGGGDITGTGYLHMTTQSSVDMTGNETDLSTFDMAAEELWQTQYLQTATVKARSHIGSMDLWDWSIIEQEKKIGKKKVKKMFRLIGRLAPNATQVHPSLRGSGGLIRTTPIREADHEFVKVSSGRVYKLRRPSSKHLTAYPGCVLSNPTQGWGFPLINADTEVDHIDTSPGRTLSSTGSGQFNKQSTSKKKYARLKFKGIDGEPQPKYRDRAAERRILHKGFGIGPGQKAVSIHELEKEEADAATEMPGALEKAASARPIGRDNIGKRMLEGMGWKEGQSLGSGDGGLVDPILALGNTGRTGLGWG